MNKIKKNIPFILLLAAGVLFAFSCAMFQGGEKHAFGDDCTHCHGDKLQGIQNTRQYCGECHDLKPQKPADIKVEEKKKAVLSEPHIHKTDNIFRSTPSCFWCHRRKDF